MKTTPDKPKKKKKRNYKTQNKCTLYLLKVDNITN